MFFTQDDYKKIQQWLTKNSVRDTEFNEANMPFNGEEIITIVQGNQNKKVFLKDLIAQVFNLGVSDFVNITDKYDAPNISLEEAIRLIPSRARKEGQVITFLDKEDHWHIYQFKGVLNQWNVLDTWEDLFDWEKLNIYHILPDEEDLTKSLPDENGNSYLSLKDRKYEPDNYSGLGRIILRKNIVEVEDPIYGKVRKNVLLQGMISKENIIYEIRYDFDLNGEKIIIPEGCVLDFQGGSLNNGVIVGNNTAIVARLTKIFGLDVELSGNWKVSESYPEWFGAVGNGTTDDAPFINKVIKETNLSSKIVLSKEYYVNSSIILKSSIEIGGNISYSTFFGNTIALIGNQNIDILKFDDDLSPLKNIYIHDVRIKNGNIGLNVNCTDFTRNILNNVSFEYCNSYGCYIKNNNGGAYVLNRFVKVYCIWNNIGGLTITKNSNDDKAWCNLNTYVDCIFSNNKEYGIFINSNSTQTNLFISCSIESNGNNNDDENKGYGVKIVSKGGNCYFENCYFEHNDAKKYCNNDDITIDDYSSVGNIIINHSYITLANCILANSSSLITVYNGGRVHLENNDIIISKSRSKTKCVVYLYNIDNFYGRLTCISGNDFSRNRDVQLIGYGGYFEYGICVSVKTINEDYRYFRGVIKPSNIYIGGEFANNNNNGLFVRNALKDMYVSINGNLRAKNKNFNLVLLENVVIPSNKIADYSNVDNITINTNGFNLTIEDTTTTTLGQIKVKNRLTFEDSIVNINISNTEYLIRQFCFFAKEIVLKNSTLNINISNPLNSSFYFAFLSKLRMDNSIININGNKRKVDFLTESAEDYSLYKVINGEDKAGFFKFDTNLNKPIWWTGTKWIDATGADV